MTRWKKWNAALLLLAAIGILTLLSHQFFFYGLTLAVLAFVVWPIFFVWLFRRRFRDFAVMTRQPSNDVESPSYPATPRKK